MSTAMPDPRHLRTGWRSPSGYRGRAAIRSVTLAAAAYVGTLVVASSVAALSFSGDGFDDLAFLAVTRVALAPLGALVAAIVGFRRWGPRDAHPAGGLLWLLLLLVALGVHAAEGIAASLPVLLLGGAGVIAYRTGLATVGGPARET